jgi:hypothetical protein
MQNEKNFSEWLRIIFLSINNLCNRIKNNIFIIYVNIMSILYFVFEKFKYLLKNLGIILIKLNFNKILINCVGFKLVNTIYYVSFRSLINKDNEKCMI